MSLPLYITLWSNTATALYLMTQKKLGNRSIGIVKVEADQVKLGKRIAEKFCASYDCFTYIMVAGVLIGSSYFAIGIIERVTHLYLEEMANREPRIPRISEYLL